MNPVISVIIPAHNEEYYLAPTLESLRRQRYPYYEVITVANGCDDRTAEIARVFSDKVIELPQRCLGKARNTGGAKARGELLVFLDADTCLEEQALETIAREFTPWSSSATLRGEPDPSGALFQLMYWAKNSVHRLHLHCGSSGVICCWRDQFKEIGGFIEELQVRENSDLIRRLKRFGPYKFIAQTNATTSMRRYEKAALRMLWLWLAIWIQSLFLDLRYRPYEPIR
jgi:glycosyltransferase involved in cell wall biosynthesis